VHRRQRGGSGLRLEKNKAIIDIKNILPWSDASHRWVCLSIGRGRGRETDLAISVHG